MVSFVEVIAVMSIGVMFSAMSMKQVRFYYALLTKFKSKYSIPDSSPLKRQQIGTGPFHNAIHGSYESEAVRELTRDLEVDRDMSNQPRSLTDEADDEVSSFFSPVR